MLPFPHSSSAKEALTGGSDGYMAFRQKTKKSEEHEKNVVELLKVLTSTDSSPDATTLYEMPARVSGQEKYKDDLKMDADNMAFMTRAVKIISARDMVSPDLSAKSSKVEKEAMIPLYQAFLAGEKNAAQVEKGMTDKSTEVFGK